MGLAVRWGLLSTADINRLALAGARESDRVDVIAVASRDEARARDYASANGIDRAYGGYEALLADPDVEAVYISLPNSLHVEWSIRALEAGKHVLCEKPLDRRVAAVESAFDAADRAGRLLMEAFMYRHNPQTDRLVELVEAGTIGELRLIRSAFSFTVSRPEDVRLSAELDGGGLMDVGSYCVSGSRLLAGKPEHVFAEQKVGPSGVDVRLAATMRFPGGVVSQFDCGLELPGREELEVIGADGSIFLGDPWHANVPEIVVRRDGKIETERLTPVNSYRLELENLGDAIRGQAEPLLGRADAVAQARAIEALYRSADTGTAVQVG